jgi:quinolinate synthase
LAAVPTAAYDQSITQPFPSLVISHRDIVPVGSFAESQAVYLQPDESAVTELVELLEATRSGIVAHYYMDAELQGVLQSVGKKLPGRVGIADSLKMGDMAVDMVSNHGCQQIACLGVDFMSESVSAILEKNGYGSIPVYRATKAKIGCSLAESAEQTAYRAWLQQESASAAAALHVVYINTSLETKAVSNSLVPTITCTSSNVLQTLLAASAQMGPNLRILYGPDTYMGDNLVTMLTVLLNDDGTGTGWSDEKIKSDLHPQHNRATLQQLRDSIAVFPSGNCVVHHMFGAQVVDTVKENYQDAYVTAHLEVPGEMFEIAMQKSLNDDGVVGSTSDILKFISRKVQEAASAAVSADHTKRLKFILGTEAGMVTSIVSSVQAILAGSSNNKDIEAEIIFPVASDAVMATDGEESSDNNMALVPGVAGGEGCSTAGGCATCPFMKMNDLDALTDVLEMVKNGSNDQLQHHLPPDRLRGKMIDGRSAMDLGTEPIVYMREFSKHQRLPDELVQRVMAGKKR